MAGQRGAHRAAIENRQLVRYTASHLLAINAEWAIFLALLVYVYDRSGAKAAGVASVVMLLPYVLAAPYAGHLTERRRPSHVRFAGLAIGETSDEGPLRSSLTAAGAIRRRPGAFGVLAVAGGQFFLVGALDLILVVAAADVLDMGDTGPGLLNTAFGIGAVVSAVVTTVVVRRRHLAGSLFSLLIVMVVMSVLFRASMTIVTAMVTLPLLGLSRASVELLGRMMLQRSAPPDELGQVFTLLEIAGGVALLAGAVATQILIVLSGPQAAMLGVGVFFALLAIATAAALRHADAEADVPVVAMSLFRRDAVFEPLPAIELEVVARSSYELTFAAGDVVIREGDSGDRYYVVADGTLKITRGGDLVRVVERGGGFGEVALLADVPRTATVTATTDCDLLVIDRVPFLRAITGHDASRQAAWGVVRAMGHGDHLPDT